MKKLNLLAIMACILLTGAANTTMTDPTRPPNSVLPAGKSGVPSGGPKLTAIFITPDKNYALIDGQTLFVGDEVGAYTITNIRHDAVELRGEQNDKLILELLPLVKQVSTVNKGR